MEELQRFLQTINENGMLWLLEAKPGLFAMLEDGNENSYVAVYATEDDAKASVCDDWEDYTVANMSLAEFIGWTRELDDDKIGIAVPAGPDGQILPIPSKIMRQMLGGQDKSDKELVGEEFYDEEWAEPMPEDWDEIEDDR